MSGDKRSRVPEYLRHILQAIERIRHYVGVLDEKGFLTDPKTQDAVIRNIEIIGEAARNVERADPGFAAQHPPRFRGRLSTRCATVSPTVISRLTWKSSGKRFETTCRRSKNKLPAS